MIGGAVDAPRRHKSGMTRQQLMDFLTTSGYKRDPRSNCSYKKTRDGVLFRMKLTKLGVRLELHVLATRTWVRVCSAYYKRLYVAEDGRLAGWKDS